MHAQCLGHICPLLWVRATLPRGRVLGEQAELQGASRGVGRARLPGSGMLGLALVLTCAAGLRARGHPAPGLALPVLG